MILIEILLFLTSLFSIFHMIDALVGKKKSLKHASDYKGFSIVVPCYNEEVCINKSIKAMHKLDYVNFEVIYINDGSFDKTYNELKSHLKLVLFRISGTVLYFQSEIYPNIYFIDKPNTGKGLSLNVGIGFAKKDIIITLDADSMLNADCLSIMNNVFADEDVVAAGGAIHITQANNIDYLEEQSIFKRILIKVQAIDYLKGFFIYKLSLSKQNAMAIISGAFGAFRKSVLLNVGGYRKSLGEDIDITIKIQRYINGTKKKIVFLPQAGCYTECPESAKDLFSQRVRWQKGFVDCILHYRKFLFTSCCKNAMSFYLIIEALIIGIFSCLLPFVSLFYLVSSYSISRLKLILIYWIIVIVFGIIYTFSSYIVANRYEFPYKRYHLVACIFETTIFKIFLLITYLFGIFAYFINRSDWNKTKRSIVLSKSKETI